MASTYIAILLTRATSDADGYEPLYAEDFVLVTADGEEEARDKALAHGRAQETSYENDRGERITWKLLRVVDVSEVLDGSLGDGADLYSRHFRNYEAYRAFEPLLSGESL
ncbi:hypothetical protein GCM10010329_34460 [Streptomyces spiroverticillatus]|uniref:DUF4288 domain-containing protein n=1 Tax=Streptomyces finlayi TaxID=67296 RepID=A0A918WXF9_9ACTN|nr:DUF4288 domain-containing protein [Streptomyces finlayi]GHA08773.1 hypothetical protein GCM10010329_34460 [Streptomyces spiroverticillatus]GHC91642.1 hypothetical protein GCM10010334_26870 [Streptomyces finlayi]